MRPFDPTDLPTLNSWYAAHGLQELRAGLIPLVGFIVPNVAAGFLYRTDAAELALIEGYVTNPAATATNRSLALHAITEELLRSARNSGIRTIVGLCRTRSIKRLALKYGFAGIGHYEMVAKEI